MNLLLDTCTFLWIITDAKELSMQARMLFSSPENNVYLSTVSVWEILIKHQLGKLSLPKSPGKFIIEQRDLHCIKPLFLHEGAVIQLSQLPDYHRDPFDRMLICQAISESLTLLTPDQRISQYPVLVSW